jgi:riboflavin biosynthesis pyrimidine reductase
VTLRRLFPHPSAEVDHAVDPLEAYALDRGRPWLRMNFVASLDGAVEVDGYSRGLSSPADQALLHALRVLTDAVMVGAGTLRHEGYGAMIMNGPDRALRAERGLAEHPTLVIVSSALDLDPSHAVFRDAPVRPVVLTHAAAPTKQRQALGPVAELVDCGDSVVDLAVGLGLLRDRGLAQNLCEGGPHLFGSLLAADLVDELCLTLSPQLAGPGAGRIVAGTLRAEPAGMRLVQLLEADGHLLARYVRA